MFRTFLALSTVLVACAPQSGSPTQCPDTPPVAAAPATAAAPAVDPAQTVQDYLTATTEGDLERAAALVADDSVVFESGGNEGTWAHYRDHHLGPELNAFAAFVIRPGEMRTSTSGDGTLAVVTLPMEYDITLKDDRRIESVGTATFTLRLLDGKHRIEHIHWSSRPRPKKGPEGSGGHGH